MQLQMERENGGNQSFCQIAKLVCIYLAMVLLIIYLIIKYKKTVLSLIGVPSAVNVFTVEMW